MTLVNILFYLLIIAVTTTVSYSSWLHIGEWKKKGKTSSRKMPEKRFQRWRRYKEYVDDILQLYETNLSITEISQKLDIPYNTVSYYLRKYLYHTAK